LKNKSPGPRPTSQLRRTILKKVQNKSNKLEGPKEAKSFTLLKK
jgi:hypothetical protein